MYVLLNIFGLLSVFSFIYHLFFIYGKFKLQIPFNKYSIRRIKYNIPEKYINELKYIAYNSVDVIPNNPFFHNKNLDNKIALIIYDSEKPIGMNVMFDYDIKNKFGDTIKCLHIGLVLIDKEYKGKKVQHYTKYNVILYLLENMCKYIYITDLGSSPSGLKIFNKGIKNSYPNLIYNTKCEDDYIAIADRLMLDFKEDLQVSNNAYLDYDKFIVRNSYNTNGYGTYLLPFNEKNTCSDEKFNSYFKEHLGKLDDFLSVGRLHIFNLVFDTIKKLF